MKRRSDYKPKPERFCERCGTQLVPRIYSSGEEEFGTFMKRRFCSLACSNTRGKKGASRTQRMVQAREAALGRAAREDELEPLTWLAVRLGRTVSGVAYASQFARINTQVRRIGRFFESVDVLVTQRGIAVNPLRKDLEDKLRAFGLPVYDIHELKDMAERVTGKPQTRVPGGRAAAEVEYRDGRIIDRIRCVD